MRDTEIVQAIVAGDAEGLAEAYRRYADRVFDYCARMLNDRDAAADAVHDTFIILQERSARLRDPEALRPWLYAVARSRCLRLLRDRRRSTPLDEVAEMHDETLEPPESGPRREDLRTLVSSALAALNPREREVIHLLLRHELSGAELAEVLGVPTKQAHAVASTARAQLKRALDTVVLARTRGQDCEELRALLAPWDGELTPLWRKRISRHIDACETCNEERRRLMSPAALLGAAPLLVAPPWVYESMLATSSDPAHADHRSALAEAAGPSRADGFPRPSATTVASLRASSAVTVVLAVLAASLVLGLPGAAAPAASSASDSPAPSEPSQEPEVGGPEVRPTPEPSGGASAAEPAGTDPTATQGAGESVLLWTQGADVTGPGCVSDWVLQVTAGGGPQARSGIVRTHGEQPAEVAMESGGSGTWHASVGGLPVGVPVAWSVTLTDAGGATHTSATYETSRPACAEQPDQPEEPNISPSGGQEDSPPPID